MGLHSEPELNRKFVEFANLMNVYLNHFPKHERYGLCLHIRQAAYDTYALIIEGQKRYHKKTTLQNLDIRHEQLRMLIMLAHEFRYFAYKDGRTSKDVASQETHRYCAMSRMVDELGRMIGGWIAHERQRESS